MNKTNSKVRYFERLDNQVTLEQWEEFKKIHPQITTGEICWNLHDSMILRRKPASDAAIVKALLVEAGIEFEPNVDYLKITSDLTDKQVLVDEVENDDLLEQLEQAGAKVLYITSNVNYNSKTPDRYFEMYPESYDINDYPAVDKRNLFIGKNIIVKYVSFYDYKNKNLFKVILQNTLKEYNMRPDKTLMNPPYDGSLHLEILEATLNTVKALNPNAEVVSVQPVRWLEDPLAEYKQNSDYKKYKKSVVDKINKLQLVSTYDASECFKITTSQDLAIYTFNNSSQSSLNLFTPIAKRCLDKILSKIKVSLKDKVDQKVHDGWRCEIKEMLPVSVGSHGGEGEWSKTNNVCIVKDTGKVVFNDGYDELGQVWYKTRQANGHEDIDFLYSIKFESKEIAENFAESCRTRFYKNLVYLVKFDQHAPLRFLPYMEDYSHIWIDEDYCKYFGLDKEETEFMCRKVDDYRIKDFINYIELDKE